MTTAALPFGSVGEQLTRGHNINIACGEADRLTDRREIRRRLTASEEARVERNRIDGHIQALEAEIEQLVERHQGDAATIHEQLRSPGVTAAQRVKLREKLQELNTRLQSDCDSLNDEIDSARQKWVEHDLQANVSSALKQRLYATAPEHLLLEYNAAQNVLERNGSIIKQAEKQLAAFENGFETKIENTARNYGKETAESARKSSLAGFEQQVAAAKAELKLLTEMQMVVVEREHSLRQQIEQG